jgi:sigma-B regulation protein RsbU (phosphoserine phosphatase)
LQSSGIAVGFEAGEIFDLTLREESINLRSGDLFVLYTDGLTEGMNNSLEEFGEFRLERVIRQANGLSANETLRITIDNYSTFIGSTEPHDDLTCVVIRIL